MLILTLKNKILESEKTNTLTLIPDFYTNLASTGRDYYWITKSGIM